MPFSSQTIRSGPYAPNGATLVYPFYFLALSAAELRVYVSDITGQETDLSGYTVEGVGLPQGQVRFAAPPSYASQSLFIEAAPSFTQETDLENQDSYNPSDVSRALDRLAQTDLWLRDRLAAGGLGLPATPGGGVAGPVYWSDIINRPISFPPSQHTHAAADLVSGRLAAARLPLPLANLAGLSFSAEKMIKITSAQGDMVLIDVPTGGGGGGGVGTPPALSAFGAINGDGASTVDNDAAFVAAEASTEDRVYIPDGVYKTTLSPTQLTKGYEGAGIILFTDGTANPGRFSYMAVKPETFPVQGATGWWRGDHRFTEGEYKVIGPNVREYDLTAFYYSSPAIPHPAWFDVRSGNSGMIARLVAAIGIGVGAAVLNGAYAALVGKLIALTDANSVNTDIVTVDTVDVVTGAITFHPNTAAAHAAGSFVRTGPRTWNGHTYLRVRGQGAGGDIYAHIARLDIDYPMKPGQTHCFEGVTGGQYGGDVYLRQHGNYGTAIESHFFGQGSDGSAKDVAVAGFPMAYVRENDGGSYACVWVNMLAKSEGSKMADVAYALLGRWRVGLESVLANMDMSTFCVDPINAGASAAHLDSVGGILPGDTLYFFNGLDNAVQETKLVNTVDPAGKVVTLTSALTFAYPAGRRVQLLNGGPTVNMKLGQRFYFNSSVRAVAGARGYDPNYASLIANELGDIYMRSANDGTSDVLEFGFNRVAPNNARIRLRPSSINLRGQVNASDKIIAVSDIVSGGIVGIAGAGSGIYLFWDGANLRATKNGGGSSAIIV